MKPTGVGFWRYVLTPGAKGAGHAWYWTWAYTLDPEFRRETKDKFADRFNGDGKWTQTGPAAEKREKRRRRKKLGRYHCRRCGYTVDGAWSTEHECAARPPTQPRHPGYHDKPSTPGRKTRTATGPAKPPPPPRRRDRPLPPVTNPTRGARIVRAGTAAERFAFLATAEPDSIEEFESMLHNLRQGVLRLSQEMADFAENTNVKQEVKAKIHKLADATAELAEPARDIRTTFRRVYKDFLAAKAAGVTEPFKKSA